MAKKKLHIHLGPHKTGSSAIQRGLKENAKLLDAQFSLTHIAISQIAKAAKLLNADRAFDAADALEDIVAKCNAAPGDCILSCEDLSGVLPGVRGIREVYPNLWRNLAALQEAFGEFDCRYYFFLRDKDMWVESAYVQNLKHRQKFSTFESFKQFLQLGPLWDDTVARAQSHLGNSFVTLRYDEKDKNSALLTLLRTVTGSDDQELANVSQPQANISPSSDEIFLMERINRSSASQEAKRLAKLALLSSDDTPAAAVKTDRSDWFSVPDKPADLLKTLAPLWKRVGQRVRTQDQPNLMPVKDADLRPFRTRIVNAEDTLPDVGRGNMTDQAKILSYRFRNLPETCFLLGLTVSYLRRDTPHTAHASALFQRLWSEEYLILLGTLPTRWLISSFQTFLDHGINENQRIIGSGAYFYANMLKAYETERSLEGMPPDTTYPETVSQTKMGFAGLDRFKLGGSDLLLNTNALLLEYSALDDVAGRVVREFMARARAAQTIFSRMDQSRKNHGINVPQFSNCWSFFEKP